MAKPSEGDLKSTELSIEAEQLMEELVRSHGYSLNDLREIAESAYTNGVSD